MNVRSWSNIRMLSLLTMLTHVARKAQKKAIILGPVSRRPTTIKWRQSSQSNRHSTIGTRQTEYHEALLSSATTRWGVTERLPSMVTLCDTRFVECRVKRRLDCENCPHLTVVGLHDTGPLLQWTSTKGIGCWYKWSISAGTQPEATLEPCSPRFFCMVTEPLNVKTFLKWYLSW